MEQEQFKKEILPLRIKLLNYAKYIVENEDDAEDIIQEVFFKLWNIRNELCQYDNVEALSMTITKNLSINYLRSRKKRQNATLKEYITDSNLSPYTRLEQKDEVEKVMGIIDRLPSLQQMILKMKHVDGMETQEIAELTGCSHEAIRVNLSRARKRVKELFLGT